MTLLDLIYILHPATLSIRRHYKTANYSSKLIMLVIASLNWTVVSHTKYYEQFLDAHFCMMTFISSGKYIEWSQWQTKLVSIPLLHFHIWWGIIMYLYSIDYVCVCMLFGIWLGIQFNLVYHVYWHHAFLLRFYCTTATLWTK